MLRALGASVKDDAAALLGQIIALASRGKGHRAFGQIARIAKRALGEVPTPTPKPVRELPSVVQVVARHVDSINRKLSRGERVPLVGGGELVNCADGTTVELLGTRRALGGTHYVREVRRYDATKRAVV